jgi:hypothetical protein
VITATTVEVANAVKKTRRTSSPRVLAEFAVLASAGCTGIFDVRPEVA